MTFHLLVIIKFFFLSWTNKIECEYIVTWLSKLVHKLDIDWVFTLFNVLSCFLETKCPFKLIECYEWCSSSTVYQYIKLLTKFFTYDFWQCKRPIFITINLGSLALQRSIIAIWDVNILFVCSLLDKFGKVYYHRHVDVLIGRHTNQDSEGDLGGDCRK